MRIVVIGASGRIGGSILTEALARGHAVTAVVRDVSVFDGSSRLGGRSRAITVVAADVFDTDAVAAAVAGSDVVISAVGHAASMDDQSYYLRAAQSLVEALRRYGADGPRLLVVGGFGSLQVVPGTQFADQGGYPDHAAPEILGQRDALTYYRTVEGVRWTYFSPPPGGIGPGERTGAYRTALDSIPGGGEPRESRVSREDFAVAMIDEAERADHRFGCVAVAH